MNIVVLQGSPNRNGSSNLLAESFRQGAQAAGHTVELVDAAHADIHPCTGCIHCGYEGPCVQQDGVQRIRGQILHADMLVFATPLYYYGMSAQLKTLLDRFCAFNSSIQRGHKKAALLAVAWNSDSWTFEALGGTLQNPGALPEPYRHGHGAGVWLRHPCHDEAFPVPAKSVRAGE